jgi:hypothetical protein
VLAVFRSLHRRVCLMPTFKRKSTSDLGMTDGEYLILGDD